MSSTYGDKLRITIFGQSHSAAIGVVIEGLEAGFAIDTDKLEAFLSRLHLCQQPGARLIYRSLFPALQGELPAELRCAP